ncbi:MAG TPA: glycosyltransferase family 1 protein [Mucilaginibacter sp.]|nr:glycosyltransferase family 1 protein [Mucilaginibacter sp.]
MKKILPDAVFVAPFNIIHNEYARELDIVIVGKNRGVLWEQFDLPRYLRSVGNPLLLNLCNAAPMTYTNQVVTVHDVAFMVNPSWFSKKFVWFYKFLIPWVARKAKLVFTVSNFSRQEIVKYFGIDAQKIKVIYNSVNHLPQLPNNFNKYGRYLLIVSSIDKRKNIERLIRAFFLVKDENIKLLVAGDTSSIFNNNELKKNYTNEKILFLGRVSDESLCNLYSNAISFVYPSLYEGFGIPPLEAISCNCPIIVSNIESLREVYGDAALFADPYSEEDIAQKITLLINDQLLRNDLIEKGKKIVNKYSWEKSARLIIDSIKYLN